MRIGVPREIKPQEYRVGITPEAAREYLRHGHDLLVESGAGSGIGAADDDYAALGAVIVNTRDALFADADMIVKVKEPQPDEWVLLRPGQILFAYLHLAADPPQARGLARSGCTAIAYETVTDGRGGLPLLAPMSEIAGRMAVESAALSLRRLQVGRGLLMGGVPGVNPARVLVIGGGNVGTQAARMAVALGADVVVIDRSLVRLRDLDTMFQGRIRTRMSTAHAIEEEIALADVVIGAVLIPGASAPHLVTRAMLGRMKKGAVLVDVAIDQGGCFETSRPTTHEDPVFIIDGIVHYCVANMPGAVPLTASQALNHATLPYGLALADNGIAALLKDEGFLSGLNVHHGQITNAAVAQSLGEKMVDARAAISA